MTEQPDDDLSQKAAVEFQRMFHDDFEAFEKKLDGIAVANNWSRHKQEQFAALLVAALAGYLLHAYAPGRLIARRVHHAQRIGAEVKSAFQVAKDERSTPILVDKATVQ